MKEFKEFVMKGNVIDLAVGLTVGVAFKEVVSSLVNNIIMPPVGLFLGGKNFRDLKVILKEATINTTEVAIGYGAFIGALVDFLIIALAIFLVVKLVNKMQKKREEE